MNYRLQEYKSKAVRFGRLKRNNVSLFLHIYIICITNLFQQFIFQMDVLEKVAESELVHCI